MAKDVALVLSSGGARGLAHIGAIEELEAQGYRITSIAGSSMGALIGGVIASFSGIFGYKISLIIAAAVAFVAFLFTLKLKGHDEQLETMISNQ